jgi:hypothetical protein
VEAADHRVEGVDAGEAAGVAGDVDDAGMAAPGEHHQTGPAEVHDQSLVVEDQRVGLPAVVVVGLVEGHAGLEVRGPRHLAGDQHRAVEQQRRLLVLDDLEPGSGQRPLAQRGQLDGVRPRQVDPPPGPQPGVDDDREVAPAHRPDQPVEAGGVVEVAVAQHHDLDVGRVDAETAHVADHAVGGHAGVEQDVAATVAPLDRHEHGEAVLGLQAVHRLALFEQGLGQLGHARHGQEPAALGRPLVQQQRVAEVVDERGEHHAVDRLQGDRLHRGVAQGARRHPGDRVRAGS